MVAQGGGNVSRDIIFNLKAAVDQKSFDRLSRFAKESQKIQEDLDKSTERSTKNRDRSEEQATRKSQQRIKQLADNRRKGIKAEEKALELAARKAEALQKKGEDAAMRFTGALQGAAEGALVLGRGLAFLSISGEENLQKLAQALVKIQGLFDVARGGIQIFRSIAEAQKAVKTATEAATAAQLAQNAARGAGAAGGAVGGAGAAFAASPGVVIAAGAAALVAGIALVNEDFRQGIGEFLGILESETDRARKALNERIETDRRRAQLEREIFDANRRERDQSFQLASKLARAQADLGVTGSAEANVRQLRLATGLAGEARGRFEEARGRPGGLGEAQRRRESLKRGRAGLQQVRGEVVGRAEAARAEGGRAGRQAFLKFLGDRDKIDQRLIENAAELKQARAAEGVEIEKIKGIQDELITASQRVIDLEIERARIIKQTGQDQKAALQNQVAQQEKAIGLAKRALETSKQQTKELQNQFTSAEQRFGALSRVEQRRLVRTAERAAGGENLSRRQTTQLAQFGDLFGEQVAGQRRRRAEEGGFERFAALSGLPQRIAESSAERAQRATALEREIEVKGILKIDIDIGVTANKAEIGEALADRIIPAIDVLKTDLGEQAAIAIQGSRNRDARETAESRLNRETN